jgi:hypothetical protein
MSAGGSAAATVMATAKATATATAPATTREAGELVELARYVVGGVERVLRGEWIGDAVDITDHPVLGVGETYYVDSCLQRDGHASVQALVADYTQHAKRLKQIPMLAPVIRPTIEQVQLASYEFTGGRRTICAQRINGVVRVTDRPADGCGRSYLVRHVHDRDGYGALSELVSEYTREARQLDQIPIAAALARCAQRTLQEQEP